MEKEIKVSQNNSALIIIVVAFLVVIIILLTKNSGKENIDVSDNNTTNTPLVQNNTVTPSPVVKPTVKEVAPQVKTNTETNKIANVEESRLCAQQAKINDDALTQRVIQAGGANYLQNMVRSYTTHYNAKQGKCFMYGTITSDNSITLGLSDVYENKDIASYSGPMIPGTSNFSMCLINGVSCTKVSFDAFVKSAMEN